MHQLTEGSVSRDAAYKRVETAVRELSRLASGESEPSGGTARSEAALPRRGKAIPLHLVLPSALLLCLAAAPAGRRDMDQLRQPQHELVEARSVFTPARAVSPTAAVLQTIPAPSPPPAETTTAGEAHFGMGVTIRAEDDRTASIVAADTTAPLKTPAAQAAREAAAREAAATTASAPVPAPMQMAGAVTRPAPAGALEMAQAAPSRLASQPTEQPIDTPPALTDPSVPKIKILPGGLPAAKAPEQPAKHEEKHEETSPAALRTQQMLIQHAEDRRKIGDVLGMRLFLERAKDLGSKDATRRLAETYDERWLALWGVRGVRPDPEMAQRLYSEAGIEPEAQQPPSGERVSGH